MWEWLVNEYESNPLAIWSAAGALLYFAWLIWNRIDYPWDRGGGGD